MKFLSDSSGSSDEAVIIMTLSFKVEEIDVFL